MQTRTSAATPSTGTDLVSVFFSTGRYYDGLTAHLQPITLLLSGLVTKRRHSTNPSAAISVSAVSLAGIFPSLSLLPALSFSSTAGLADVCNKGHIGNEG